MKKTNVLMLAVAVAVLGFAGGVAAQKKGAEAQLTPASEVKWFPLDPTAGDKGPMASVVFGDMKKKAPIGVLLKVPAGGVATPHTHGSDYWGVSIAGSGTNYVPGQLVGATPLPQTSSWFQPAKQPHDNKCLEGADCISFLYFPKGFDFIPWKEPAAKGAKPKKESMPAKATE